MNVLVTGGAGYIGSHTCLALLEAGYGVVVADNLSNSSEESLARVMALTGKSLVFYRADIGDRAAMDKIFAENEIGAVIHFAGLKAVGESVAIPLAYYKNNVSGTITLLEAMAQAKVKKIVFSSSATVYGLAEKMPLTEDMPTSATNPYGRTKLMLEQILTDAAAADAGLSVSLLRYFNPIGAHESGRIGENPRGIPNNLMPYITQVATGKLPKLRVFGNDYPTSDGTGVRDYIHVMDLAAGHLAALSYLENKTGVFTHNLGTGTGYSVLDLVNTFSRVNHIDIPYEIAPRRPGDVAVCYAGVQKAKNELGFTASRTLEDMCASSWNWQKNNPEGY